MRFLAPSRPQPTSSCLKSSTPNPKTLALSECEPKLIDSLTLNASDLKLLIATTKQALTWGLGMQGSLGMLVRLYVCVCGFWIVLLGDCSKMRCPSAIEVLRVPDF